MCGMVPVSYTHLESPGFYPNLTATENLQIFATLRGIPNRHSIKNTLDLVGLPYKDKKLFSQYSLGMKQRLAIALAVMHDPELLILDEPINGLSLIHICFPKKQPRYRKKKHSRNRLHPPPLIILSMKLPPNVQRI